MPIVFKRGNLFEEPVEAMVNAVNCQGRMGAGIALEFAKEFPNMYESYKHLCGNGGLKIGHLHMFRDILVRGAGHTQTRRIVLIINLPTKNQIFRGSEVEYITKGLMALRKFLLEETDSPYPVPNSVALPALGCGHGGLEWSVVRPLIEATLADVPQRIVVFEPLEETVHVQFAGGSTDTRG